MARFGQSSSTVIDEAVTELTPVNTKKARESAWRQFAQFCGERNYNLNEEISVQRLALILKDFAFNMRKSNGEDYKETVVKTLWNTVAKILQEKYYNEFNVIFDPFKDVEFSCARNARNAKRKELQSSLEKRKRSSASLTHDEVEKILNIWDETTPTGLQRKFFHLVAYELAWRGGEGTNCLLSYFEEEYDNSGNFTGRISYNPLFSKTAQGGNHPLPQKRWLVENKMNPKNCPVR